MNPQTRQQLGAVNRRFYHRFASEFSTSRERPWPGWRRVVDQLVPAAGEPLSVLDVGCGNGRFGAYLASRRAGSCRYLGLDGSRELLRFATRRLAATGLATELRQMDILAPELPELLAGQRFDLVAIFGLLHHLPGSGTRRELLRRLAEILMPGGVLAASIWQPERGERFRRRVVPWQSYNLRLARRGQSPIDSRDLEAGDFLLTWSGDLEDPRYCHFPEAAEVQSWIDEVEPRLVDRFASDGPSGRDNQYLVFRRCL